MNTAVTPTSAPSPSGLPLLWFRSHEDEAPWINETAVRIRAGLMLAIPIYMAFTLFSIVFGSHWVVTGNMIKDTFDTDFDGRILYMVEAVRRTYDYTTQTYVLLYAMFEMVVGMFKRTSYLSPTIWLASFLARRHQPYWKPLAPKRFAWFIGASMISVCMVFFHPEKFAAALNFVTQTQLLPTTEQYLPRVLPLYMVWICLGFMWLETVLGFCVGCYLYNLAARVGLVKEECEACNNLKF